MKKYTKEDVEKLEPQSSDESVYLIIDEVQANLDDVLWYYLLRGSSKIITIGAGVPDVASYTLSFRFKEDPDFIVISDDDVEESVKLFLNFTKSLDEHVVRNTLSWVQNYTGGQAYPFFVISAYLLTKYPDKCSTGEFELIVNSHEFLLSREYSDIKSRAFGIPSDVTYAACSVIESGPTYAHVFLLSRYGLWDQNTN